VNVSSRCHKPLPSCAEGSHLFPSISNSCRTFSKYPQSAFDQEWYFRRSTAPSLSFDPLSDSPLVFTESFAPANFEFHRRPSSSSSHHLTSPLSNTSCCLTSKWTQPPAPLDRNQISCKSPVLISYRDLAFARPPWTVTLRAASIWLLEGPWL